MQESEDKKALENPGGDKLLESLKGTGQGLPFFAFVDANGKMIANTRRTTEEDKEGSNIGHPAKAEEIAWYMEMLKKAAPKMTAEERATLEKWLKDQKLG